MKYISEVKMIVEDYINKRPETPLTMEDYQEFFVNGNRLNFENKYFQRRKYLCALAIMCLIEPTHKYFEALESIMKEMCQEYSWALPAHLPVSPIERDYTQSENTVIDLFAAETAQSLSEIATIFSDQLSEQLKDNISELIEKRIFLPFESKKWEWENFENNWSAVIGGAIGLTALFQLASHPKRLQIILDRLQGVFSNYFKSYGNDGACEEGVDYWAYGFGYYNYFSEQFEKYFNQPFFKNEQLLNKIAAFPAKVELFDHFFLPFSDSTNTELPSGLLTYCNKRYGVEIPKISEITSINADHCYRWAVNYRNWLWTQIYNPEFPDNYSHYLSDVQWLIEKKPLYYFAAKGGNNNESHNHNDLGHFILGNKSELVFTDLGAGEYTKDYFNDETRYQILNNRSKGHSVPIINGLEQQNGEYSAKVTKVEINSSINTSIKFILTSAYPESAHLDFYQRDFTLLNNSIRIEDTMRFTTYNNKVIQNFVSKYKPIIDGTIVSWKVGSKKYQLCIDSVFNQVEYHKETYSNHEGIEEEVFLIQISTFNIVANYQMKVKILVEEEL